jgi:hypothetical protein
MTEQQIKILMKQQDPPAKTYRPRHKSQVVTDARRQQLHDNEGVWFVWQDNAKNRAYERKMLWHLLGLRQGAKFSKGVIPYESRIVHNNDGKSFTLFVRYSPIQNPESQSASQATDTLLLS